MDFIASLDFKKYPDGLIPTIIQHEASGKVLMLGFSSEESLKLSDETRVATFFSRSKKALWKKGETSGHILEIKSIHFDCDDDTLLFKCIPHGPTCHTGRDSCFFKGEEFSTQAEVLFSIYDTIKKRKAGETHNSSYVSSLFESGLDRIAQKVGEEAVETVIAAKNDDKDEFIGEFSDLLFHMMVLLEEKGVSMRDIMDKFEERNKKS